MGIAKFVVLDPNEPDRRSYLNLECHYNGGRWWQDAFPGHQKRVFPAIRGEWKKEEVKNGKAGKLCDNIILYSGGNRLGSFMFQEFKHGDKFHGKYVPMHEFPTSVGELMWSGDFVANTVSAPPAAKNFTIRASGGLGLGYGVIGKDYLQFEITDKFENRSATYFYDGIGLSVGIKKLPQTPGGLGLSTKGPANDFTAHGWRTVEEFEGDASSGGVSVNLSTSLGFNWFTFSDIKIAPFNGGDGYSMPSVGHTQGNFKLIK